MGWLSPLLRTGSQRPLQAQDMLTLEPDLQPQVCGRQLYAAWTYELLLRPRAPSLLRTLASAYGWQYAAYGLVKLLQDALGFAGPLLLRELIAWLIAPLPSPPGMSASAAAAATTRATPAAEAAAATAAALAAAAAGAGSVGTLPAGALRGGPNLPDGVRHWLAAVVEWLREGLVWLLGALGPSSPCFGLLVVAALVGTSVLKVSCAPCAQHR
jgi:hypothetical protein